MNLNVVYMDSDDRNAYPVQAADYVANALYGWFEYEDPIYYDRFHSKIHHALKFPYKNFGKQETFDVAILHIFIKNIARFPFIWYHNGSKSIYCNYMGA